MGGNVEFVLGISKFTADPIPVMTEPARLAVIVTVWKILNAIKNDMSSIHLVSDFIAGYTPHESDNVFSGSTAVLFSNIDWRPLEKTKPYLGDIDVKINQVHEKAFLNYLSAVEKSNGDLIGFQKSGDNIITLWYIPKLNINMQIDFECVEFVNGIPQEWEKFYRSSNARDMSFGLRGAFHKYMLRAITARKLHSAITYTKVKRIRKEIETSNIAVSPKGVRIPYVEVANENGLPVYEPASELYSRNTAKCLKTIFGLGESINAYGAPDGVIKSADSFVGLCESCQFNYNKDLKLKIMDGLCHSLFSKGCQSFFKNDPEKDLQEKLNAVTIAAKIMNITDETNVLLNQRYALSSYKHN